VSSLVVIVRKESRETYRKTQNASYCLNVPKKENDTHYKDQNPAVPHTPDTSSLQPNTA